MSSLFNFTFRDTVSCDVGFFISNGTFALTLVCCRVAATVYYEDVTFHFSICSQAFCQQLSGAIC